VGSANGRPPIPEILRGRLDGNSREQFLALRAYEKECAAYDEGLAEECIFEVEVPVTGYKVFEVAATDAAEAEAIVAEGMIDELGALQDEMEMMWDCARVRGVVRSTYDS